MSVRSPERARVEVLVELKKSYEKLSPQERDTVRKVLAGIVGRRTAWVRQQSLQEHLADSGVVARRR